MKKIAIICLFCLTSSNLKAQIERHGDVIWIPIQQYKSIRTQIFLCDSLKQDYDSLITSMDESILIKDSIITNLTNKIELKDSIIVSKNQTIQALTKLPDSNKFKISNQLWMGILGGLLTGIIILK